MSTQKYVNYVRHSYSFRISLLDVKNTSYLAEFVRDRMRDNNLSTYDVARRAGNKISAATVTKIMNREVRSSGVDTLDALAEGLGVDRRDVYNAARGIDNELPDRFQIYAERFDAADLTLDEWLFLETIFNDDVRHFRQRRETINQQVGGEGDDPPAAANQEMALARDVPTIEPGTPAVADKLRQRNEIATDLHGVGKKRKAK